MPSVSDFLTAEGKAYAQSRVDAGEASSIEEAVNRILEESKSREDAAVEKLEAELVASRESGRAIAVNDEYWGAKRSRLAAMSAARRQ